MVDKKTFDDMAKLSWGLILFSLQNQAHQVIIKLLGCDQGCSHIQEQSLCPYAIKLRQELMQTLVRYHVQGN